MKRIVGLIVFGGLMLGFAIFGVCFVFFVSVFNRLRPCADRSVLLKWCADYFFLSSSTTSNSASTTSSFFGWGSSVEAPEAASGAGPAEAAAAL